MHLADPARRRQTVRSKVLALSGVLAGNFLFGSPALALDASDFINGLQKSFQEKGNALSFGSMEEDGSGGAVLQNVKLEDMKTGNVITIKKISLSGTEQIGDNGYLFGRMQANDFAMISTRNEVKNTLSIGEMRVDDFSYPDRSLVDNPFWPMNMAAGEFTNVRMDGKGTEQFSAIFPSIKIGDLKSTGGKAFTIGSLESATATGFFANPGNAEGTFSLGAVSIHNGAYFGGAGYAIDALELGEMSLDGTSEENEKIVFTYDGLKGQNLFSPDLSTYDEILWPEKDMVFDSGGAVFSLDETDIITLKGANSFTAFDPESKSYDTTAKVDDLFLNIEAFPMQPGQEASRKKFTDMGYNSITLDLDIDGGWNIDSGILDLRRYKLSAQDMAAVALSTTIGGFTLDFARQLAQISNKISSADDEIKQALTMQMLALYSGLTVNSLSISIDDASLTKRVMDQQAAKSGQEAKDLAKAMPFLAGAMLSELNIPEFAASVSAAISTFMTSALDNKGNFTVTASPDEPISFAEIMGIAAGAQAGNVEPSEVVDRLNLSVTAK